MRERSTIRWLAVGLAAGLVALVAALPGPASAAPGADGGASAPASTGSTGATGSASGGGLDVAPRSLLLGQDVTVSGSVPAADAGRAVVLQVRGEKGSWTAVVRARAAADGSFSLTWRTTRSGELQLRAVCRRGPQSTAVVASVSSGVATVLVYQQVLATWYGPGFYGKRTACGELMTAHIVGVADRTLPCGTPVSLSYDGVQVTVPVIDRGPYSSDATLDLSQALAEELGITTTEPVGMAVLAGPAIAPATWTAPPSAGATGTTGATGPTAVAGGAAAPLT